MAISVKKAKLSNSMNPFVIIQLTSNHFLSSNGSYGSNRFAITPCRLNAVKLPLVTANSVLHQVKREFPLAQISYEVR
ncbi:MULTISPECIES: hypothetical protein [unclassified Vibrio]|uniref:hypothetical protein n=1 Tax=unclassified Vibrio TaxID=2614977 RepID=UPI000B8E4806|nr:MULTISPECIES: hypothetical protein [unclassified Vibrio]NAX42237.1 hypothetical protein [Vibrio sp. V25_P4S6T154]OXX40600.1 hypothetical protein B9J93_21785 [Vibrio sp. V17_P4S1T151]OXX59519.1 hypothetical protein B9J89_21295 [Vibrio sp. V15_P4S5T153]OXX63460.1 hypothetical protein B9J94_16790 [Vibrio sp. V20_P4S3T152]